MRWLWIVLIVVLLFLFVPKQTKDGVVSKVTPKSIAEIKRLYAEAVAFASRIWSIPESRIFAIIQQESAGDPAAIGPVNEIGLMQLTPQGFEEVQKHYSLGYVYPADMYDPEKNIRTGTALLRVYLDRYGDLDSATEAYNRGRPLAGGDTAYLLKVRERESNFA